jgi:hypothetical protein
MEQIKEMVNNIRHVLVNESFKLFARENVIDLGQLSDLQIVSLQMAGFSMMSDEFQVQFKHLMIVWTQLSGLVGALKENEEDLLKLAEALKPFGFILKDIPAMEPWVRGEESLVSSTGITVLECKPFSFIIDRFH